MSELLPSLQARSLQDGLVDYLRTTFSLADDETGLALEEFLHDRTDGIFKGPYLRLRLPFAPADEGWRDTLDWYEGFPPYAHQAAAFARLSSRGSSADRPRPQPTLVTTGTGSGKTEAFLYPILDHVLRARRDGVTGTKALILYPMNALANDQAGRLARLIAGSERLVGVTAALYTGQDGPARTTVSERGLITDRAVIRSSAPDILLTNYKMLDQMLLREADAPIWQQSATSLQYVVLDEFHTYDGAQGTDVSMLLRRLGMTLKSHWTGDTPGVTDADRARPLGKVTPVATSATLGAEEDPRRMLDFARTVFGETFAPDAVITETRLDVDRWIGPEGTDERRELTPARIRRALACVGALESPDGFEVTAAVLSAFAVEDEPPPTFEPGDERRMLDLLRSLPLTRDLVERCRQAVPLRDLAASLPGTPAEAEEFLLVFAAALSHVRAVVGRDALSVDLHLWVRELTRIDRDVSHVPRFSWSDDGAREDDTPALPAIYCRHCGRSGWGVPLAPVGTGLETDVESIRARRAAGDERFRALLHAPVEGERALDGPNHAENLAWLSLAEWRLLPRPPADDRDRAVREGSVLPVLAHLGDDAGPLSLNDVCPSCLQPDGIRFLGSAVATMLSVTVSTIFGTEGLDAAEKKALVFTDSVQDAAHRAGFVQSRSHTLTLRSVIRQAVGDRPLALDVLVDRIIEDAGDDRHRRYRILPPELTDREEFLPFWDAPTLSEVPPKVRARVARRLLLDVELEFGLQSRLGRTLELTGTLAAGVDVSATMLTAAARWALDEGAQGRVDASPDEQALLAWGRGVVERMRERGALDHEWFRGYQRDDGRRYSIWGGRDRANGMPAFPHGRPAPGYPRIGGKRQAASELDPVTGSQSWYARWAAKNLGLPVAEAAVLARLLMERLARMGAIDVNAYPDGHRVFQLAPSSIVVTPVAVDDLEAGRHRLTCTVCRAVVPGTIDTVAQLDGAPCMVARCEGTLAPTPAQVGFYRRLYESTDVRRVVAREHTSQLDDETRLDYERGFKAADSDPDAPNVLVATPTLEMGIDIGDLSTVILAGLPRSVASYLQRVGRAGRLTGNALDLAFVSGRGDQLPRLGDPLSVINGEVRPPATYLDADEILRRQYIASVADRLARDPDAPHPRRATEAMNATDEDGFLNVLATRAEENAAAYLDEFLAGFPDLSPSAAASLRAWATPTDGPGTSGLADRLFTEAHRWAVAVDELGFREREILDSLDELRQRAEGPAATDLDRADHRTAKAALRLVRAQRSRLRGDYWIGVLEEHGLLPNYTLLDDSVDLDVALSWIDPETGEYESEPQTFRRGSALALREFAPGATFYARGRRIRIDAVDLGHDAEAVTTTVFCPRCGHSAPLGERPAPACPRCGDTGFGDVRQRIDTVELKRVSSAMRRDESVIDDRSDERERESFIVTVTADVDPARTVRRWFVDGYGFGVRHLREMAITWVNLGRASSAGSPRRIAGGEVNAPLFRVCASCGRLDTSVQRNSAAEHRPWCPNRRAAEERTKTVALTRRLVTEGLVIRLPHMIAVGDRFALPSLSAALLLGLREVIGGAPDHLAVETIVDPSPGPDEMDHEAILLHDVVPGGTGYLAELADPDGIREILARAWRVVRDCDCADEGRLACHRCLLPFAPPGRASEVSRVAAERHLRDILLAGGRGDVETAPPWRLTEEPVVRFDPESKIERKFRAVLQERLSALNAHVVERPGPRGSRLIIRLGGRTWTLDPQQNVLGSCPDFLLQCDQPLPKIAIFCDGWTYHASVDHNRLDDDAAKRAILRDAGFLVLAVTWADLESDGEGPLWADEEAVQILGADSSLGLRPGTLDLVTKNAVDQLISWLVDPDVQQREGLANALPLVTFPRAVMGTCPPETSLAELAVGLLDGDELPPGADVWHWTYDTVSLVARLRGGRESIEVAVVIDDRDERLGPEHRDAWRAWLGLANLLNPRVPATTITTRSLVGTAAVEASESMTAPAGWESLFATATDQEVRFLRLLAGRNVPHPTLGHETEGGIPLSFAWPERRLAVDTGFTDADRSELEAEGWRLVEAEADAVERALTTEGR